MEHRTGRVVLKLPSSLGSRRKAEINGVYVFSLSRGNEDLDSFIKSTGVRASKVVSIFSGEFGAQGEATWAAQNNGVHDLT